MGSLLSNREIKLKHCLNFVAYHIFQQMMEHISKAWENESFLNSDENSSSSCGIVQVYWLFAHPHMSDAC